MGHGLIPRPRLTASLITLSSSGGKNSISIGPGRMYVDVSLTKITGSTQLLRHRGGFFLALPGRECPDRPQRNLRHHRRPAPPRRDYAELTYRPALRCPTDNGQYIFYLDVWSRPITCLKIRTSSTRPSGSIPRASPNRVAGQVHEQQRRMDLLHALTRRYGHLQLPACLLLTSFPMPRPVPAALPPAPAYTGVENQFYRVEIHQNGRRLPVRLLRPRTLFPQESRPQLSNGRAKMPRYKPASRLSPAVKIRPMRR